MTRVELSLNNINSNIEKLVNSFRFEFYSDLSVSPTIYKSLPELIEGSGRDYTSASESPDLQVIFPNGKFVSTIFAGMGTTDYGSPLTMPAPSPFEKLLNLLEDEAIAIDPQISRIGVKVTSMDWQTSGVLDAGVPKTINSVIFKGELYYSYQ